MTLEKDFFIYEGIPVTLYPGFGWHFHFNFQGTDYAELYTGKPLAERSAKAKIDNLKLKKELNG